MTGTPTTKYAVTPREELEDVVANLCCDSGMYEEIRAEVKDQSLIDELQDVVNRIREDAGLPL